MAKSLPVQLNPDLLVWARESIGLQLEEAARSIGIKAEKLAECEAGEETLSFAQLKKAADSYKRSLGVFFLPTPPEEPAPLPDFRMPLEKRGKPYSKYLLLEMRRARRRRSQIIELSRLLDIDFENFSLSCNLEDDTKSVASKARNFLKIDIKEQISWKSEYKALNSWIMAVERREILVFQAQRIPTDEMSGFCIYNSKLPIIVLNSAYKPYGKIFTLLHEFVHVMVRTSGVSDAFSVQANSNNRHVYLLEKFCNEVAAEILVPSEILSQVFKGQDGSYLDYISDYFSVSKEVVARKLHRDGLISDQELGKNITLIYKIYEDAKKSSKKSGFLHPITRVVRDNGVNFTRTVVTSFERGQIDDFSFREYLGTDSSNIPEIKTLLASRNPIREDIEND